MVLAIVSACFAANGVSALEMPDICVAGYRIFTVRRTPKNSLPEERVVIRGSTKGKPLWRSDWGHTTRVAAFARSGVTKEDFQPDVTGDGTTKLYVWVAQDAGDFVASLTVLKMGANVQVLAIIPACAGEGPRLEKAKDSKCTTVATEQFVPLIEGRSVDVPTTTVYLRWTNGAVHVAADLMRNTAPTASELAVNAKRLRMLFGHAPSNEMNDDGEPWRLWSEAADLAWSGNESTALNLIEQAWPPGRAGIKTREAEFLNLLRSSVWYREMHPSKASSSR